MKQLIAMLTLTCVSVASANEYHVAITGNDANPGTARKPFATIAKARDAARAFEGPDTIILAPGRYFHAEPLVLDDRDSGLTIKGKKSGAVAEVYGGVPVTGWEKWKGDIWRAPVPKGRRFFNLIVDGKPATMAQTPNEGSGYGGGAGFASAGITVPPSWRAYDFADAQVACFIGTCWFNEMRAVLADKADANGHLPIHPGCGALFGGLNGGMSFVRGVLELLDEPGEWCLKHKEGYVYYWPSPGTLEGAASGTPADHVIARPVSERFIEVHGRSPETPARNITLENISIIGSDFAANWELFKSENVDCNTFPASARQGLVFGENVDGLRVVGCKILAAGHSAVFLNHYAQNCSIKDCVISKAGVSAVYLHGWAMGTGPFKSLEESYVNKGNRVENCLIYDCGKFIPTVGAIATYQSGDLVVEHNEILEAGRCGFMVNGVRWGVMPKEQYGKKLAFKDYFDANHNRRVRVVGNDIYNVCRNTDDFGAIEAWGTGRDNLWENNAVHDLEHCQQWDTWGHAIFPDDSDHYMAVRGNIVHHFYGGHLTRAIMVKNIEQVVENNLVVDCGISAPVTFSPFVEPAWEVTIRNNIFADRKGWIPYANMNEYCLTGKSFLDAVVPAGAKGIREIDHNWIVPKDPNNPNPFLDRFKIDQHSTFGPEPVKRMKPDWDIQAADYQITPRPDWWKPIDCSRIGLRPDFPFDKVKVMHHGVGGKIQAELYQRRHKLRARGGTNIFAIEAGAWAKYACVDFGNGEAEKAVFEMTAKALDNKAPKPFIRKYSTETVAEIPFKGDQSVETIMAWEISKPYGQPGKTGADLLGQVFEPEQDIKAGTWSPYLRPVTSRLGVTSKPGVVDFHVANGEEPRDSCAYARASVWAETGRENATMTIECAAAAKVWLNGSLVIKADEPSTHSETKKGIIKAGWNTILVKVAQGSNPTEFRFKFGTVASSCGRIVSLPGLPTEERRLAADGRELVELRLDSPVDGKLIGTLLSGQSECAVGKVSGIRNLYLVFPHGNVNSVDWFSFK